jgi:predicted protein tyrosine phosphatase
MAIKPLNILFVCTANRLRSPTAERVFGSWPGLEVSSAGLDASAGRVIDEAMVAKADVIFCMEPGHRDRLRKRFKPALGGKQVIVLGIPDEYERDQPELVALLRKKVAPFLE